MIPRTLVALLFWVTAAGAQQSFSLRLDQLAASTALVLPSQAIDEYPVWSPDSESIAAMVEGRWVKLELKGLDLVAATWHGSPIAAARKPNLIPLPEEDFKKWDRLSKHSPRQAKLPREGLIRLSQHGLSTRLELVDRKGRSRTLWSSDLENCVELSVSPNGQFVAYICELNGLMVSDVRRLTSDSAK